MSTNKKINLLQSIEYSNNFELIGNTLLKWNKRKKNSEVTELIKAVNQNYFYTHQLEMKQDTVDEIVSEYRLAKNRAVLRARKAESRVQELETLVQKYKDILGD
jgi:transcription initiation factor TFIIIB Brf1 subunit/transcription initiation factor TFIIB